MTNTSTMHDFNSAIDALLSHCRKQPDRVAYQVLDKKGSIIADMDYLTLWNRSHSIAQVIATHSMPGDRIAIIYDTELDFICTLLGCFMANTIAIPCAQPQQLPNKAHVSLIRLQSLMENATPILILTTAKTQALLQDPATSELLGSKKQALSNLTIIDSNSITTETHPLQTKDIKPIAYLQYTSGTTGNPKGVIITHNNVSNNINNILNGLEDIDPNMFKTAVNWLPLHHDMGLINAVLLPLYAGQLSVLISPMNFLRNPYVWLQAIASHPSVMSGGPNFSYDFCCKKISEEQKASLDLSSWSVAYVGADTSREHQLMEFITTFSDCNIKPTVFHPCYGLAEATVYVTGDRTFKGLQVTSFARDSLVQLQATPSASDDAAPLVNTGTPFADHECLIINPDTLTPCPSNAIGEIWIKGPSVSPGYWNNAEETEDNFQGYTKEGLGPYLRTGDYGFYYQDNLYIYGRIKDSIIIRGMNFAPNDIEWVVQQTIVQIKPDNVVAFPIERDNQEQLVVVAVIKQDDTLNYPHILRDINHAIITNFGITSHDIALVTAKALPTTSSGKLIRKQCKQDYLNQQYTIIAASS